VSHCYVNAKIIKAPELSTVTDRRHPAKILPTVQQCSPGAFEVSR
jgi:hypothetical protein